MLRVVIELYLEGVRGSNLKRFYATNNILHFISYFSGSIGIGSESRSPRSAQQPSGKEYYPAQQIKYAADCNPEYPEREEHQPDEWVQYQNEDGQRPAQNQ